MVRAGTLTGIAGALALLSLVAPAAEADDADIHLDLCAGKPEPALCEAARAEFRHAFADAMGGGYQGQRNVAYMLETGDHGGIRRNPVLACAWRMVILRSGSPRIDRSDLGNLRFTCGRLDPVESATAEAQAKRLLTTIRR